MHPIEDSVEARQASLLACQAPREVNLGANWVVSVGSVLEHAEVAGDSWQAIAEFGKHRAKARLSLSEQDLVDMDDDLVHLLVWRKESLDAVSAPPAACSRQA